MIITLNEGKTFLWQWDTKQYLEITGDAAGKGYVDGRVVTFTGKTVPVSAWAASDELKDAGFGYRAGVSLPGVTETMVADVYLSGVDAAGGDYSTVARTYQGGVYLYCGAPPSKVLTIPVIRVTK